MSYEAVPCGLWGESTAEGRKVNGCVFWIQLGGRLGLFALVVRWFGWRSHKTTSRANPGLYTYLHIALGKTGSRNCF